MKICAPVLEDRGLESRVSEHFGSAPFFLLYEVEQRQSEVIANTNRHHSHGMCNPLQVLSPYKLDAVVCAGLLSPVRCFKSIMRGSVGAGAVSRLAAAGIKAYVGGAGTARDAIEAFSVNKLSEASLDKACAGHDCH